MHLFVAKRNLKMEEDPKLTGFDHVATIGYDAKGQSNQSISQRINQTMNQVTTIALWARSMVHSFAHLFVCLLTLLTPSLV